MGGWGLASIGCYAREWATDGANPVGNRRRVDDHSVVEPSLFLGTHRIGQLALWLKRWIVRNVVFVVGLGLGALSVTWGVRRVQVWWGLRLRNARRGRVASHYDRARDLVQRRWQIPEPSAASSGGTMAGELERVRWLSRWKHWLGFIIGFDTVGKMIGFWSPMRWKRRPCFEYYQGAEEHDSV